jgi:hypothetical protein
VEDPEHHDHGHLLRRHRAGEVHEYRHLQRCGRSPGFTDRSTTKKGNDTLGSFSFNFNHRIKVPAGIHWLSVQANMDFDAAGQWGWMTRSVQGGLPAAFQNSGDGFGTGCTSWAVMTMCLPYLEGDLMFSLGGRQR